jgi:hypothetical protein
MAFDPSMLKALGGGAGFWLWHYRTADAPDVVLSPGYFDGHDGLLAPGHMVLASAGVGASQPQGLILYVRAATRRNADVEKLSAPSLAMREPA